MVHVPPGVPPFITFRSPYGGLGLKTRSAAGARARVDKLAALATDVVLRKVSLEVFEPCTRALAERLRGGPIDRDLAFSGGGSTRADLPAAVAAEGHRHDDVAAEAWQRFGAPNAHGIRQMKQGFHVGWVWQREDPATNAAELDAWFPYLVKHEKLPLDDYAPRLEIHGRWSFRLRGAGAPFPPSEVSAHLRGMHACAFFDLVWPHAAADQAFLTAYQQVCSAMGLTLPMGSLRLSAPKRRGDGRTLKKVT